MDQKKRVAMIVPMKGKVNLLVRLLLSIVYHSSYDRDYLDIYIADTGSSEKEKAMVKRFLFRVEEENNLHCKMIEYDFYNFAKINNDVVRHHIRKDTDFVLLCNNDVELINDAISVCVMELSENEGTVGTVGARLMFPDNTVQHAGIVVRYNKSGQPTFTHAMLKKPFKMKKNITRLVSWGNTGAFMMVSYKDYIENGLMPEGYNICFEDVEFNLRLLRQGRDNITRLDAICFHNESSTREKTVSDADVKKIRAYVNGDSFFKERYNKITASK